MNEETSNTLNIKEADVEAFDEAWSLFIEQGGQYKWYQPSKDGYLWCRVQDFELMLMRCKGEFGFHNKNWSRLERFRYRCAALPPQHHDAAQRRMDPGEGKLWLELARTSTRTEEERL